MSGASTLPAGFESLEPFVLRWATTTLSGRDTRRLESSAEERLAFHAAAQGLLPSAMSYLDTKPLESFDASDRRLMNLMLALIHVALAVEVQAEGEVLHAAGARGLPIVRGHADECPSAHS
jgi:hypothetical protein